MVNYRRLLPQPCKIPWAICPVFFLPPPFDIPARMQIGCLLLLTMTWPVYPPKVFNFLLRCFPLLV